MPINIGSNLEIKNNEMNATQEELFKKLNVAKAWTNTQTTSAGGTAVVLVNDANVIKSETCEDINQCILGNDVFTSEYTFSKCVIINGEIYLYNNSLVKIGTKTDYVCVSRTGGNIFYAIDSSGYLWRIKDGVEEQISNDNTWTSLGYTPGANNSCCGINDGKIYYLDYNTNPTQKYTSLTNIIKLLAVGYYDNVIGVCIDSNGYLYSLNNNTPTLIDSNNNWVYAYLTNYGTPKGIFINNNNELYYLEGLTLYKQNLSNVKCGDGTIFLTNDNKIYCGTSLKTVDGSNYGTYTDISNNLDWSYISCGGSSFYAISNGYLYKIIVNIQTKAVTYEQVGTESDSGYMKVDGKYNDNSRISLAWTGDATSFSHTVYTTKSPQVNDKTYKNGDLEIYSTIQSTGVGTITDEFRTYNRDISKDTSFTAIPPATLHETVTTLEFLNITNPNN